MTTTRKELIVGVVFFSILAMIGVFTILVRGVNPFKPPQELVVYFADGVGGLREGNVVRISGLEVGQVEKMRLQERGVLAHLKVQRGVNVYPGYQITVRAFSPLGGKYVDIRRGDQSRTRLTLDLLQSKSFKQLNFAATTGFQYDGTSKGLPLHGAVEAELISELAELAENIRPNVEAAMRNIRETTEKINSMQGTIGKLVGDPALFDSLRAAAENFERASGALASVLTKVDENAGTLGRLINDPVLYETTTRAISRIGNIAAKVDDGRGVVGRLFNESELTDRVERSMKSVATVLATLEATDEHPLGKGTLGRLFHDPRVNDELARTLTEMDTLLARLNAGRTPAGILLADESAGESVRRTLASIERSSANVERVTLALRKGEGTVGRLIMDDRLVQEAERVLVQLRESVEDVREQAPIQAFVQAVFQAF